MAKPARKAKKRAPIEWGYENGRHVVTHATGKWSLDMPGPRLHGLRDTVKDLQQVAAAFRAARGLPDREWILVTRMTVTVADTLIWQLVGDLEAILALSPTLRATIAKVDENLSKAAEGGAT